MNLILENTRGVPYFTDIRAVFAALGIAPGDYDWFLSDLDTVPMLPELGREARWMDGGALQRLLDTTDLQFIWAVFTAVEKGRRFDVDDPPHADGNCACWTGDVQPQLPGALFEIVCWDSGATLLIGLPEVLAANFKRAFPDVKPLVPV
jgi:hypothetical protein